MPEFMNVPQFTLAVGQFERPKVRPWNMLSGTNDCGSKEDLLGQILIKCVEASEWIAIDIAPENLPKGIVKDDLLVEVEPGRYMLTKKAVGLLYSIYGK